MTPPATARPNRGVLARAAALPLVAVLAACASGGSGGEPAGCGPAGDARDFDHAALADLAGAYELTMAAESGPMAGATARGRLTLLAYRGPLRQMANPGGEPMEGVVTPYYGTTDIDVASVGAVRLGSAASADSLQPGVLFVQRYDPDTGTPATITLRVGADGNDRRATRFDGGYVALRVSHAAADRLLGRWVSGVTAETASGYFCAVRGAPAP